ncbi:MAG: hypothetical protein ACREUW_02120 [Burkholderiales bacterium]
MHLALYLLLLIAGNLFLVGGLFITRQTWRTDVEPFGRRSRYFQIALHPERYARADRLGLIRGLNLAGALLMFGALLVVGYDIMVSMGWR